MAIVSTSATRTTAKPVARAPSVKVVTPLSPAKVPRVVGSSLVTTARSKVIRPVKIAPVVKTTPRAPTSGQIENERRKQELKAQQERQARERARLSDEKLKAAKQKQVTNTINRTAARVPAAVPVEISRTEGTQVSKFNIAETQTKKNTDMVGLGVLAATGIQAGISALKGSSDGLFSGGGLLKNLGAGKEVRQERRQDRREARQERRAVRRGETMTVTKPKTAGTAAKPATTAAARNGNVYYQDTFFTRAMDWMQDNWYYVLIPLVLAVVIFLALKAVKKKNNKAAIKARLARARRAKAAKARTGGSLTRRKSSSTRRTGRKKTQAEIKAERLRNLAKARRALKARKK